MFLLGEDLMSASNYLTILDGDKWIGPWVAYANLSTGDYYQYKMGDDKKPICEDGCPVLVAKKGDLTVKVTDNCPPELVKIIDDILHERYMASSRQIRWHSGFRESEDAIMINKEGQTWDEYCETAEHITITKVEK